MGRIARLVVAVLAALCAAAPAHAHPHVWVTMTSEMMYAPDGAITGVRHAWAFDDMFSAFALQGIGSKQKGVYTRAELEPLAKVNVTSLKEYDFFNYAKANGKKILFTDPVDYWLDYHNAVLTLHFTLPLKTPIKTQNLNLEIYDPSIFVDFEFAKTKPVSLVGAPADCKLTVTLPHEPSAADMKRLSQLDEMPLEAADVYGEQFANKISVLCP